MSDRKIIAIAGATGAQGGGLARALLADRDGPFAVRALARDCTSAAACLLRAQGAEVVAADLDDDASLVRAFEGAHGAFCNTFFWAHLDAARETLHARRLAEAAAAAGVRHVVWSTLEDTRRWMRLDDARMPTLQARYKVPHMDAKGEADAHFAALGLPVTRLLTSFYWDNLVHLGMHPRRGADGRLHFALPMGDRPLPGVAADDIGRVAHAVFAQGADWVGREIGIAGEHLTGAQMANALSRALGEDVVYDAVPFDVFRAQDFPGAEELGNMFQFKHDFEAVYRGHRDPAAARALVPALQTFEDWLARHAGQLPRA